ncbi:hypothetical protein [Frigoriglobus tundricola]|uniref:Uncharacterized protein n=1 Tax=Frigoriglobus tundricola TaxID=2774151 RepID=A0A6M5YVZ9_9BACT|nr:hypothetical protein [Frigoriglobus tundricola]QJW97654.1 hypothetical protein FTUN_5231 [Frigoriglobus tundricola]
MLWFRNRRTERARPNTFRPRVEALDDRCVPSASSVLASNGLNQVYVDANSDLVLVSPNGQQTALYDGSVRTAQGFRAADGALGIDVVFTDGSAIHYDPSAGGVLTLSNTFFGGNILDLSTAYSASGRVRIDVLVANSGSPSTALGQTGHVMEFTTSGGLQSLALGTHVRWVSAYQDTAGNTGIAIGQELGSSEFLAQKADTVTGLTTLYDGLNDASAAITGYTQSVSSFAAGNQEVVTDLTFNSDTSLSSAVTGTYALQFTAGTAAFSGTGLGVTLVGTSGDVKPGG